MISQCTRRIMFIASDAPVAHMPSVMRSALLRRKIRGRCVRSSVSSAAGLIGGRRTGSITIRLRRHATSGAGERESRSEKSSREVQEILRQEAATPHTARSGGVSEMLHRTTVRGVDLIGGTVSAGLGDRTPREGRDAAASAVNKLSNANEAPTSRLPETSASVGAFHFHFIYSSFV